MNVEKAVQSTNSFQGFLQVMESGTGTVDIQSVTTTGNYYFDDGCYPNSQIIYPTYYFNHNNNMETAFKILKVLLDKKLIKVDSVKEFIELIDIIKKEL